MNLNLHEYFHYKILQKFITGLLDKFDDSLIAIEAKLELGSYRLIPSPQKHDVLYQIGTIALRNMLMDAFNHQ